MLPEKHFAFSIKDLFICVRNLFRKRLSPEGPFSVFKKNLSLRYTASFLVIVIISAAFGCLAPFMAMNFAREQIREKNDGAAGHIRATLDSNLRLVMEYTLAATSDKALLDFSSKPYSRDFIKEASSANLFPAPADPAINNLVVKTAVYFNDSDMMVSGGNACHASTFFQESLPVSGVSAEQLYQLIKSSSGRCFVPAADYFPDGKTVSYKCIMYVQPFPLTATPKGKLITLIDCRQLVKSFAENFGDNDSCFFIADSRGTVLYSLGNSTIPAPAYQASDSGTGGYSADGDNVLYNIKSANYGNLSYIYAEDTAGMANDVLPINIITAIYLLLLFGTGISTIIWISRGTQPASGDLCNSSAEPEDNARSMAVDNIIGADETDESSKSLTAMEYADHTMRKNVISNILRGEFADSSAIIKTCDKNDISFVSEDFCVLYFNLSEIIGPDIPIIKYALSNIVLEVLEPLATIFTDDTEPDSLSVIVNLRSIKADTKKYIDEQLIFLQTFFAEQFAVSVNMGAGDIVTGIENIASSYSSARESARYSILSGSSDVLPYSRIKTRDYYYFYPLETESKLVFATMNGDGEQVKQTIDHIIEANSMLSLDMYKCLFFDLTATALKIMSHKNIDVSYISGDKSTPFELLSKCRSTSDLAKTIHEIFGKICGHTSEGHNMKKEKLRSAILEFIQKNYSNPNMSLAMVADEFSMNYTYMSHFFKDFIGMNFIDYVSDLRVKKASELLRTTTMSIADISAAVGYANSTVLIKIFKKITNTTPGAYRKNIR